MQLIHASAMKLEVYNWISPYNHTRIFKLTFIRVFLLSLVQVNSENSGSLHHCDSEIIPLKMNSIMENCISK
uniref:Uncharacterized protein n=1 Tax=Glycine max TaxID=3847 RepID=C6TFB2_SOYBN|nr:unknown [Glycine max]